MIITCGQCGTKFRFPDEKLRPGGTKVRCGRCSFSFTVQPPGPPTGDETRVADPGEIPVSLYRGGDGTAPFPAAPADPAQPAAADDEPTEVVPCAPEKREFQVPAFASTGHHVVPPPKPSAPPLPSAVCDDVEPIFEGIPSQPPRTSEQRRKTLSLFTSDLEAEVMKLDEIPASPPQPLETVTRQTMTLDNEPGLALFGTPDSRMQNQQDGLSLKPASTGMPQEGSPRAPAVPPVENPFSAPFAVAVGTVDAPVTPADHDAAIVSSVRRTLSLFSGADAPAAQKEPPPAEPAPVQAAEIPPPGPPQPPVEPAPVPAAVKGPDDFVFQRNDFFAQLDALDRQPAPAPAAPQILPAPMEAPPAAADSDMASFIEPSGGLQPAYEPVPAASIPERPPAQSAGSGIALDEPAKPQVTGARKPAAGKRPPAARPADAAPSIFPWVMALLLLIVPLAVLSFKAATRPATGRSGIAVSGFGIHTLKNGRRAALVTGEVRGGLGEGMELRLIAFDRAGKKAVEETFKPSRPLPPSEIFELGSQEEARSKIASRKPDGKGGAGAFQAIILDPPPDFETFNLRVEAVSAR